MMPARRTRPEPVTGVVALRPEAGPPSDPTASGRFAAWHDDLAAMVAHDLKTPLAAVLMNLEFVLSEIPADAPEPVRGALEDCRAANVAASRIVADMMDMARVQAGQLRPTPTDIDVASLFAAVLACAATDAAARQVGITTAADAATAWGDGELVRRSLERLLERAVRYAPIGGSVGIALSRGVVTLRVAGAGRGPDPAAAGRSLGVHFAESVMRAQGGAVWVETDADGALAFRLALPRRRSLSP